MATTKTMIYSTLAEWTHLESAHHSATKGDARGGEGLRTALAAKELEILSFRPRTKAEALVQLRFCAIFLERNCDKGILAAGAIRNAADVLH
jgi:hypothetical protein